MRWHGVQKVQIEFIQSIVGKVAYVGAGDIKFKNFALKTATFVRSEY